MKNCTKVLLNHTLVVSLMFGLLSQAVNNADAQNLSVLHNFTAFTDSTNADGASPNSLVLVSNKLFGTTQRGGNSPVNGTIFSFDLSGSEITTLHLFSGADGFNPNRGLLVSSNRIVGTTQYGGDMGRGTIFALNLDGSEFTNLYSFSSATNDRGMNPTAGLLPFAQKFYGTCSMDYYPYDGTVFAINADGTGFTNLHAFGGVDGSMPYANLISEGNLLYGTTWQGGQFNNGTIFSITSEGTGFTNLHDFTATSGTTNSDGTYSVTALVSSGDVLYGAAFSGGAFGRGTLFRIGTDGTGFTNLHNFSGGKEGTYPVSLSLQGDTLYGITQGIPVQGDTVDTGSIFSMNTNGTGFVTLYSFSELPPSAPYTNSDGANPRSFIVRGDTFYGTTLYGGNSGNGTLFSFSILPKLAISLSGTNVVVTWPTNFTAFKLESTTNLTAPSWFTNSSIPIVTNGLNTVFNPVSEAQQFLRLTR